MTDLMWHVASEDADANHGNERLMRAKVAVAGVWPFLSLAKSAAEFDHRMALVAGTIDDKVPGDLIESVTASLREDFSRTAEYNDAAWQEREKAMWADRDNPTVSPGPHGDNDDAVSHAEKATRYYPQSGYGNDIDGWADRHREMNPERYDPAGDNVGKHGALSPEELAKKTPDAQGRYKLDPSDPNDARLIRQRQSDNHEDRDRYDDYDDQRARRKGASVSYMPDHNGLPHRPPLSQLSDEDKAARYQQTRDAYGPDALSPLDDDLDHGGSGAGAKVHHPAGWTAHHDSQGAISIGHAATPDAVYDMVDPTAHATPRDALHSWVDAGHGRWAEQNVLSVRRHIKNLKQSSRQSVQFWHEGAKRWVTASVDQGPVGEGANPYYFSGGAELGVNTFNTGQYPDFPAGPDPVDPINQQYPMQPSPWNNNGGWSTNDMHLMPGAQNYKQSTRKVADDRVPHPNQNREEWAYHKGREAGDATGGLFGSDGYEPKGERNIPLGCPREHEDAFHRGYEEGFGKHASVRTAADGWRDEGVQTGTGHNPYFFDAGPEGVAAGDSDGFAAQPPIMGNPDLSVRPEQTSEPLENRSDWYQNLTPMSQQDNSPGMGPTTGSRLPFSREAIAGPEGGGPGFGGFDPKTQSPMDAIKSMIPGMGGGSSAPKAPIPNDAFKMNSGGAGGANVPQDGGGSDGADMSGMGGAKTSLRFVWAAGEGDTGTGNAPQPPPSMTGGPGSTAMPPMQSTPASTPPATQPGGGAGGPEMNAGEPNAPQGPLPPTTSMRALAAELNRAVETVDDPTGLGDEFKDKAMSHALEQRPRQSPEHRNVNTPQKPAEPIPTVSSPGPGAEGDEEEER